MRERETPSTSPGVKIGIQNVLKRDDKYESSPTLGQTWSPSKVVLTKFSWFLSVNIGIQKYCMCKRNDKYQVIVGKWSKMTTYSTELKVNSLKL